MQDFLYTFNSVYPYHVAFTSTRAGEKVFYPLPLPPRDSSDVGIATLQDNGHEIILVGSAKPIDLDEKTLNQNFNKLSNKSKQLLNFVSLDSGERIINLILFNENTIKGFYNNGKLITDDKPRLEFSTPNNRIKLGIVEGRGSAIEEITNFVISQ